MADLSIGNRAKVQLDAGQTLRVEAEGGTTTVTAIYGAPAGVTTVTGSASFGPYGVPAVLDVRCVSGAASYATVRDEIPAASFTASQVVAAQAMVSEYENAGSGDLSMRPLLSVENTPVVTMLADGSDLANVITSSDALCQYWGARRYTNTGGTRMGDNNGYTARNGTPAYFAIGTDSQVVQLKVYLPVAARRSWRLWVGDGESGPLYPVRVLPMGPGATINTTNGSTTITGSAISPRLLHATIAAAGVPAGTTIVRTNWTGDTAELSQPATATATSVAATFTSADGYGWGAAVNTVYRMTLTFPTRKPRRIVLWNEGGTANISAGKFDDFFAPRIDIGAPLVVVGDSWTDAAIGGLLQIPMFLGYSNVIPVSAGGTGYLKTNSGSGAGTYRTRWASDGAPNSPSRVILIGSLNDADVGGVTYQQLYDECSATYAAIKTDAPGARIDVLGPQWANATPDAARDVIESAVLAAARDSGARSVISTKAYITGTSTMNTSLASASGSSGIYTDPTDSLHLAPFMGYRYWSNRAARDLLAS